MKCENRKIVYEVGDWILCRNDENPKAYRIQSIEEKTSYGVGVRLNNDDGSWLYNNQASPATQQEINEATKEEKIMIGDMEVLFQSDGIQVSYVWVTKELFLKIGKKAGWL